MFSNHSFHDRKVAGILMPLHARVMKETVCLIDYMKTVENTNTNTPEKGSAEVEQIAKRYLRKILAELESPAEFFHLDGSKKLDVKPRRKSAVYTARYIAENLTKLYARIDINDSNIYHAGSSHSRLYNNLSYYRMALLMAASTLEGSPSKSKRFGSAKSIKLRLYQLRDKSDRLVAIPVAVVDQFKEKSYLRANTDIEASVSQGNVSCGLEHFVLQGVREAKAGGRTVPGVDLSLIADDNSAHEPDQLAEYMSVLDSTGMFDEQWYVNQYGECKNPLLEYCQTGYANGRAPNALFDQAWYCETYPSIKPSVILPAYHYAQMGEKEGRMPCEQFDAQWYRKQNKLGVNAGLALVHYLQTGLSTQLNPNALFDAKFYSAKYADVRTAEISPVDHYYQIGWLEQRVPSAAFNAPEYQINILNGSSDCNPITHVLLEKYESKKAVEAYVPFTQINAKSQVDDEPKVLGDIASNIRYFANAGPDYEASSSIDCSQLAQRAKTVAFYLPQFHAFEDNDNWWGTGFTEWRNVSRGTPRYDGHYQPRIPRDLGFYDLNDESVLHKQSELALKSGIEAFCFYYYWFNGKRLMNKPLDMFANADMKQEFCIMFANENWTRTWDGFDREVLIEQDYKDEDEDDFIEDAAVYFRNKRYMRVNGRPLYIVYRPGLLPDAKETLARWRAKWKQAIGVEPHMLMVQGFGDEDPREFGLDGAVEFPPHKICQDVPNMQNKLTILDPNYEGNTKAYSDIVERSLTEEPPEFPLIKTVVPHWDNDARREGRGFTMHGSTPTLYESWLGGAVSYAEKNPFNNEPLVFINAWNEWAEGAYLEPDVHYGHAYLNATQRAVYGLTTSNNRQKLLLVGHDAYKHGAQMILMGIAKICAHQFGLDVTILLKDGGPLVSEYNKVCRTVVLDQLGEQSLDTWVRQEEFDVAICNTCVTGDLMPALSKAGLRTVTLIHELPTLIKEYGLESNVKNIADLSDHTIFPSHIVQDGFNTFESDTNTKQQVLSQGLYQPIKYEADKRQALRAELGIPVDAKVVLNVGFADLRKGFDIFLEVARKMIAESSDVHFVWVGEIEQSLERWVQSDLDATLAKQIHLVGFTNEVSDYYSTADCLLLTSREDPYPSVVLEALCVGAPVIVFKGTTGFDKLISQYGQVVERNDTESINKALAHCLYNDTREEKVARVQYVDENCRYDDYCFGLLQLLKPDLKKVSVVIPSYNYENFMSSRLGSVFDQTYPIFETIVLDDCSKDNSVAVIGDYAKGVNRIIELVENEKNSGNVFHQWKKGLKACRGDIVWIAEADDLAEPKFIETSLKSFNDSTALSFTNSRQIGVNNEFIAENYDYYYQIVDPKLFENDFHLNGVEFIRRAMSTRNVIMNVSSVLWKRDVLEEALDSVGDALFDIKLVGDWRLYLEALATKGRTVAYISESLNVHRRHDESVTHSLDHDVHLQEIESMHAWVSKLIDADYVVEKEMEDYIGELRVQFGKSVKQIDKVA